MTAKKKSGRAPVRACAGMIKRKWACNVTRHFKIRMSPKAQHATKSLRGFSRATHGLVGPKVWELVRSPQIVIYIVK